MKSSTSAPAPHFSAHPPTLPNPIFSPQVPSLHTNYSTPSQLLHLKVGLLTVAGHGSAGGSEKVSPRKVRGYSESNQPPVQQSFTLPLMLHLHPALLHSTPSTAASSVAGVDDLTSFLPPTLHRLQSLILPTILQNLTRMLSEVKVRHLSHHRGNRVGLLRSPEFIWTFTFKETHAPYHVLTVSSKRIRQVNSRTHDSSAAASSASASSAAASSSSSTAAPSHNYSHSSQLHEFDLFSNPQTRIELLPIDRTTQHQHDRRSSGSGSAASSDDVSEGVGYYRGNCYASYLVSRHTLHVRMIPKQRWCQQIELERNQERKRRKRVSTSVDVNFEEDEEKDEEKAKNETVGTKRKKQSPLKEKNETEENRVKKKRKGEKADQLHQQSLDAAASAIASGDVDASDMSELLADSMNADDLAVEDDASADWLNYGL